MQRPEEISRDQLEHLLERQSPDNVNEDQGYALVNVLEPETFDQERIPGSMNIPIGNEDRFERRFAKDKQIIVYCASETCDASPKVAEELHERGFTRVYDYAEGMQDWKQADNPVEGRAA